MMDPQDTLGQIDGAVEDLVQFSDDEEGNVATTQSMLADIDLMSDPAAADTAVTDAALSVDLYSALTDTANISKDREHSLDDTFDDGFVLLSSQDAVAEYDASAAARRASVGVAPTMDDDLDHLFNQNSATSYSLPTSPVTGHKLEKRHSNSFQEVAARGLMSKNFDVTSNVQSGDHREIEVNTVEKLMDKLGCSFDEARLHLVMEQMKDAGVDPATGLPVITKGGGMNETTRRIRSDWNNLLTACRPPDHEKTRDGWKQLDVLLSVKGLDTADLSQAIESEKVRAKSTKSKFRLGLSKLASKVSGADTTNVDESSCKLIVYQSKTVELVLTEDKDVKNDAMSDYELVFTSEPQPISTSIGFIAGVMLTLPPPPAFCQLKFHLILESGTINKVVGKALCNSKELFSTSNNSLMMESTVQNAVDSILMVLSKQSRRNWIPILLPTARWLSQLYRCDTQLDMPGIVYEQLCETNIGYELPEKFLKVRASELVDEHARIEGKLGEIDMIMAEHKMPHIMSNVMTNGTLEGDLMEANTAHEQNRMRNQQHLARNTFTLLRDKCASEVRNYRTLVSYYRECMAKGAHTKYSNQRGESALRAVPTNLHIHSVSVAQRQGDRAAEDDEIPSSATKAQCTVTCGAPAAHAFGFGGGGLSTMIGKARQSAIRLSCDHLSKVKLIHWSAAYVIKTTHGEHVFPEPWVNVEAESALAKLVFDIRIRIDAVVAQALSQITTAFIVRLEEIWRAGDHNDILRISKIGFLCSLESLLSTAGKEIGMLHDVQGVVDIIKESFCFRIKQRQVGKESDTVAVVQNGNRTGYYVDVLVDQALWDWLPDKTKGSTSIVILPVLFTQGVNEWQMFSNLVRTSTLQSDINARSLQSLQQYSGLCFKYDMQIGEPSRTIQLASQTIVELTKSNKAASKDYEILWLTADCCRLLGGGRIVFCKSGKDRTSQAVTLESTRLLARYNGLEHAWTQRLADLMRIYGVRRSNVFFNTGAFSYAFNTLQIRALPPPYRPPLGTHR